MVRYVVESSLSISIYTLRDCIMPHDMFTCHKHQPRTVITFLHPDLT